jgi:hypothetical protein
MVPAGRPGGGRRVGQFGIAPDWFPPANASLRQSASRNIGCHLALVQFVELALRAERTHVQCAPVKHAAGYPVAKVGIRPQAAQERPEPLHDGVGLDLREAV